MSWVDEVVAQQILRQALAQQDVVAQLAGEFHGFLPGGTSSLRLAGEEAKGAEGGERLDEQPTGV